MRRGQGALEYLLLIGGGVLVASIVLVLVLGISNSGTGGVRNSVHLIQIKQLMAQSGLGYWALDESSGTLASDGSGKGLNGTLGAGASFSSGKYGGGARFNGASNSYVIISPASPSGLDLTSNFTWAAWINPADGAERMIFNKESTYEWECTGGVIQWALQTTGGAWYWANTGVTCPANQWNFFALTYDGTNVRIYKNNGKGPASTLAHSYPGPVIPNSNPLCIGARGGSCGGTNFNGSIDEVMIFNRVLGDAEIAGLGS